MFVKNKNIDNGKKFDWGRTSENYAKYRDIYPEEFYEKIIKHGLCVKGLVQVKQFIQLKFLIAIINILNLYIMMNTLLKFILQDKAGTEG